MVATGRDGRTLVERSGRQGAGAPAREGPPLGTVRETVDAFVRASDGRGYLEVQTAVLAEPAADPGSGSEPPRVLGHVRVGLSTEPFRRKTRGFMLTVLAATVPLALLGVGLTVVLARRITAPIERLQEVARVIGSGRLDLRAAVSGTVEIAELGQAFNGMLDEVHRSHLELEGRAAQLATTNTQLASEIDERRKAEQALRRSEERYALAARAANDGLWDWDLETGELYFSPRWKAMLGLRDSEVGARIEDWLDRVHPEDVSRLRQGIEDPLGGRTEQLHCLYRIAHAHDGVRWMQCRGLTVRDERGRPLRLAGSQSDVTGQKRAEPCRRADPVPGRQRGRRGRRRGVAPGRGDPAQRRHRDVPREELGGAPRRLRRVHARRGRGAAVARERAAPRPREAGVRAALPADPGHRQRGNPGLRGSPALAPSDPGHSAARGVPLGAGRDAAHRPGGPLAARGGLPPDRPLAGRRPRSRGRAGQCQRLERPVRPAFVRPESPRGARRGFRPGGSLWRSPRACS